VIVVDTNILIYAADADSQFHVVCRKWLEECRKGVDVWYATWSIVYEFLRVTTHPRVMRNPWEASRAWRFVEALLESPGFNLLTPTERHAAIAEQVIAEMPYVTGNLFHDAHTAILMREHGIRQICTRDPDFYRFSFLEVIDPVKSR
jgi:uncharacterized protein